MTMDGCKLKEVGVRLLLSSRSEMQKVIETARQQSVSVFQLNGAAPAPVVPVVAPQVQIPPPLLQSQQLLLAQQLLQQQAAQQQQHLPFNSTVTAIPGLGGITKMDYPAQTMPALINDRNRASNDKRLSVGGGVGPRDRRRDSRSRSRDRDRRVRSTSRDRSRRNRSRSRSPDRRYRRRRDKRSYSRDEYDSDDSDSRSSGGRKRASPPKANNVQVWDSQVVNSFRAAVYSNGGVPSADNGRGQNNANGLQKLRERRNEVVDPKRPEDTNDTAIDLTEDDHNCCVKVSNIERTTGYGELRRFFQGLPVRQNGLKMINDNQGKRTGVAYVRFHRPESRKFAIMRSGQVLNGNKLTVLTLDDNEFEEAVDSYRPPLSSLTTSPQNRMAVNGNGGGSGNPVKISEGTVAAAAAPQPLAFDQILFTCLKITDVPSLTTEQDIMRVFSEYGLMHIIITKDKQKRNCAFIKLNRAEDAKRVLREKNDYTMAHKRVTVTMCSEAVFEEVMNSTAITEAPVVVEDDMDLSVQERTQSPAHSATKPKTEAKQKGGSRWGEKVESPPMQLPIIPPVTIPAALLAHNKPDNGMKQLPTRWSCEEVRPMQAQMDPILSQLNLALPFLSTLLPQAAAAVKNVEQQQQQQYHNLQQQPQQQQPEMAPVSRDPRLKNITSSHANIPRGVANDPRNNNPRFNSGPRRDETDCVVVSNLESSCSDLDVAAFFSKAGIVPLRVHILLSTTGGPSGDAFVEFSNSKEANAALLQNERLLGKNPVFVETIPREQVEEVLASFGRGGGGGRGGHKTPQIIPQAPASIYNQFAATGINPGLLRGANPRAPMQGPPFAPGIMNPGLRPGGGPPETHVLALNNVPYRAGVDDILEFFDGFDIRPQDVMRRFNDQGQPTAEAKVRFKNPAEARKAFDQSKSGKILGRTIFLEFDP